ncbi:hypothetical protein QFZ28_000163 [Neobacillus niacini]|uniref:hypothetical protein n=1 Tax=Neobacillus niacini TaxID=86668 RepID=UPI002784C473|nr:hypothetical protein [Neobacillus niacini]MDQ0999763.1 hypothetical protein [Neobacillus niacini]
MKNEIILTEKDIYYKQDLVFPANTTIPIEADFVKVYHAISEELKKEIQKHFPYENELYIGFGIEKYFGMKLFHKEPQHPWQEGYKEEVLVISKDIVIEDMPDF